MCPEPYICIQGATPNPNAGYTNFDSIFGSFLSTFRLITRDYWENLLHFVLATSGLWHIVTFIGIIFIISYQVLSLIWGQIALSYNYVRLQRWERNLIAEDVDADDATSQTTNNDKSIRTHRTLTFRLEVDLSKYFFFLQMRTAGRNSNEFVSLPSIIHVPFCSLLFA